MSEIKPSDYMIPVQAELLPDGSIKIHETILRGGQSTQSIAFELDKDGYLDGTHFEGSLHVDEWCMHYKHLYLVAAQVVRSNLTELTARGRVAMINQSNCVFVLECADGERIQLNYRAPMFLASLLHALTGYTDGQRVEVIYSDEELLQVRMI